MELRKANILIRCDKIPHDDNCVDLRMLIYDMPEITMTKLLSPIHDSDYCIGASMVVEPNEPTSRKAEQILLAIPGVSKVEITFS